MHLYFYPLLSPHRASLFYGNCAGQGFQLSCLFNQTQECFSAYLFLSPEVAMGLFFLLGIILSILPSYCLSAFLSICLPVLLLYPSACLLNALLILLLFLLLKLSASSCAIEMNQRCLLYVDPNIAHFFIHAEPLTQSLQVTNSKIRATSPPNKSNFCYLEPAWRIFCSCKQYILTPQLRQTPC